MLGQEGAGCSHSKKMRRKADTENDDSVPLQLAQCWFHGLAISKAKIVICFSNKIYGSNFIKQHSENVVVSNYKNADWSLRKKIIVSFI